MSLRTLALIVVLAALGVGAILFFGRERRRASPAVAPATEVADPPDSEPAALAEARSDDEAAPLAQREATPAATAPAESQPSADATSAASDDVLVLEVIDGTSNTPVADALVRYSTSERLAQWSCFADGFPVAAERVRTDVRGLARLAVPRSTTVSVLAIRPGLLGEAVFSARSDAQTGERRERLVLVHDWDLAVEVVDDSDRPVADAPVRLDGLGRDGPADTQATGADGRALFPRVGHELTADSGRVLRVSTAVELEDEVAVRVEREPPPGEPVRLRLSSFGSVEAEVLASDGSPASRSARVTLRVNDPDERARSPFSRSQPARDTYAWVRAGHVRFERIALGHELELSVEDGPEHGQVVVAGPRTAGEEAHATLQLALAGTVLRFRALDPDGRPVLWRLEASVTTAVSSVPQGIVAAVEDHFEIPLEPELAQGDASELEVYSPTRALGARVSLGRSFPPGRVDLGDVVLAPVPIVVAGRVVDAAGEPVARAHVTCVAGATEQRAGRLLPRVHGSEGTDAQGAFALHGFAEVGRVRLIAMGASGGSEPLEVAVGARNVELVLEGTGALAGRVLLDPGVPVVLAYALARTDPRSASGYGEIVTRKDGSFELQGNPPRTYTLVITSEGEVLAEVAGLTVVAGETTRDPRLQALDLRGRLHAFRIELVPPSPQIVPACRLVYVASGSTAPEHSFWIGPGGERVLVTPLARIDATVRVRGCRIEHLTDLAPRTEVHLRAGFPVRFVLPPGVTVPDPPLFLGVALSTEGNWLDGEPTFFDEHGETLYPASEPGRTKVIWILETRLSSSGTSRPIKLPEQFVGVVDRPGEQRIELALTSDELAAALRAQ